MPSSNSPEFIVARWLAQNSYEKTLSSFLLEAGLPPDTDLSSTGHLTLERVLEEKHLYDQSQVYEKHNDNQKTQLAWTLPAPSSPQILDIPLPTNILHVSVDTVTHDRQVEDVLSFAMADRRVIQAKIADDMQHFEPVLTQDSPILSWIRVPESEQWIGTTMSGRVFVYTVNEQIPPLSRTDHNRYCIKAALNTSQPDEWLLATIGWDSKLNIYSITPQDIPDRPIAALDAPISTLQLDSIPEDILWLKAPIYTSQHSSSPQPCTLLLSRRSSSSLYYYAPTSPAPTLLGSQNISPHASSWNTLTPTSLALSPVDSNLLAIAVSALPHMKLLLVRLLVPEERDSATAFPRAEATDMESHTAYARAALAKANSEEAAIELYVSTEAPQTPYSTPQVVWRPDGSGFWVNGDDGCVRGIERKTGKVVATLRAGHEAASKIRTLWAGYVADVDDGGSKTELVVSGGFDRRVVVWRIANDA